MSKQFPLISRAFPGLKIHDGGTLSVGRFRFATAPDLERELEKAVRVYGIKPADQIWYFDQQGGPSDTHTALLIGIEPIVRDTAEDLLKEIVACDGDGSTRLSKQQYERARKLLEAKR